MFLFREPKNRLDALIQGTVLTAASRWKQFLLNVLINGALVGAGYWIGYQATERKHNAQTAVVIQEIKREIEQRSYGASPLEANRLKALEESVDSLGGLLQNDSPASEQETLNFINQYLATSTRKE